MQQARRKHGVKVLNFNNKILAVCSIKQVTKKIELTKVCDKKLPQITWRVFSDLPSDLLSRSYVLGLVSQKYQPIPLFSCRHF